MKSVSLILIAFFVVMGCSGNYGKLGTQSESDSKTTQQELIDNWSEYNVWLSHRWALGLAVIVFDPKNDDRKILVESNWDTVKDQEMWTEIVKANTTSDGDFSLVGACCGTTGVQEIWGPDNQLYGFIINQKTVVEWVNAKLVEENTMRLSWQQLKRVGNPL